MQRMIFNNIPTRDLEAADTFYEAMGFEKNPLFSDEQASCWAASDAIFVMVLTEQYFATFLRDGDEPSVRSKRISTLHALSFSSITELTEVFERVVNAGGSSYRPVSEPFPGMAEAAVKDPDGHVWELMWMDPHFASEGPPDMV